MVVATGIEDGAAQGTSPSSPAGVGVPINSEIQCGASAVALEPYDAKITLLQTLRGAEAWDRIKASDPGNPPPKDGFDYVLARVGFELKARGAPGNKSFELGLPFQFTAFTQSGKEYEAPSVKPPKPQLAGQARAGSAMEGWLVFQVDQRDTTPLMIFDPASGGAMLRGNVLWFKLH